MALEEVEYDLDWEARRCRIGQLSAKDSRAVVARLMNIIGAGLRELGSASAEAAAEAIIAGATLQRMDHAMLDWLTEIFAKVTYIESEAGSERWLTPAQVIDLAFGGNAGTARWFRWLTFCVEHSCGDFFVAALGEVNRLKAKMGASASPSISQRSGGFTASQSAAATPMG